jgi:beta-galactosidase
VKKAYQQVDVRPVDLSVGRIRLANRFDFTDLSELRLGWRILADGVPIDSGSVASLAAPPNETVEVELGYGLPEPEPGVEYFLDLSLERKQASRLIPAGHQVASAQLALPVTRSVVAVTPASLPEVTLERSEGEARISGPDFAARFDLAEGRLTSLRQGETELLRAGPWLNLWRAATDNDWGNELPRRAAVWRHAPERATLVESEVTPLSEHAVLVRFRHRIDDEQGVRVATWSTSWTVLGSGDILVESAFEKASGALPELPRIGMNLELPRDFDRMTWYGRGPFENYWDRNTAAYVGRYHGSVAEQYVPYVRPQENGNKTDVRWVALTNEGGVGLLAVGMPHLSVSAHHNVLEDFESPEAGLMDRHEAVNRHLTDVRPRDLVSLDLDHRQMGVGGNNSWGAETIEPYRLLEDHYHYAFRLRPFRSDRESAADLARQRFEPR